MPKLRAALILMIIFVALASWYKNQRREEAAAGSPVVDTDSIPAATPSATPTPTPEAQSPSPSSSSGARFINPETQTLVRDCLAKSPTLSSIAITDKTLLEDVLRDLSAKTDSAKLSVHVKRANGVEERLLVQPSEGLSKKSYKVGDDDVRIFGVDDEGLPIAKNFPRELKHESIAHTVRAFIGNDETTFRERRAHAVFEGGVATSVETNGVLTELQLNFNRTTLGCAWQNNALNCACL